MGLLSGHNTMRRYLHNRTDWQSCV